VRESKLVLLGDKLINEFFLFHYLVLREAEVSVNLLLKSVYLLLQSQPLSVIIHRQCLAHHNRLLLLLLLLGERLWLGGRRGR
jgi:hypothetical protein